VGAFRAPLRIRKGTGVVGRVFDSGQAVLVRDAQKNLQFNPMIDRRTKFRTRSILCAPIRLGGRVLGCVELMNKSRGEFTDDDLRMVENLSSLIAPGLTSSRLHQQMKQQQQNEKRVLQQAISGDKQRFMSPLVREIMKSVAQILETERCTLFLSDPKEKKLWAIVSQGLDHVHIEIPDNRGIAGSVFSNNVTLNIPDCYSDPRFNKAVDKESGFKTRTILCSPIPHAVLGKPIGVIQAINKVGGVFTKNDEVRMEQLCSMVSSILMTSDHLDELTVSAELNERVFQCLSVAVVVLSASGHCTKVNRDARDLFFLESSTQWLGKHAAETFAQTNPKILELWSRCVETGRELTETLRVFPFLGEAEGEHRSARAVPFKAAQEGIIGTVIILCPTPTANAHRSEGTTPSSHSPLPTDVAKALDMLPHGAGAEPEKKELLS